MKSINLGRSIFRNFVARFKSLRVRKTTTWIVTIAMLLSIFGAMMPAVLAEEPSPVSVVILSPFEYLEPSTVNSPNDKDGYPPQTSSADVEEGILQCKIEARINSTDWRVDFRCPGSSYRG